MTLPTQWTWVWASSERWWRTRRPAVLQATGCRESDVIWELNNSTTSKDPLRVGEPWETAPGVGGLAVGGPLWFFWRCLSEDGQDGEVARNRLSWSCGGAGERPHALPTRLSLGSVGEARGQRQWSRFELAWDLPCCVTTVKARPFSGPQFLHLWNEAD